MNCLSDWLARLEARNREPIVLGLERVQAVRQRLGLNPDFPLITVGGTNGKGSVCACLEAMLADTGYRVGLYTSPHLLRYNERVRIDEREVVDADLCAAFAAVEAAREDTPLTYFEQGTLAAMWLFQRARLDVAVLEVGLGGRLDAVNVWDADCAVVVSVDLDHQGFLGDTRETIGFEKAGIFRTGRPALCGDAAPPHSLLEHAQRIGANLLCAGQDFQWETEAASWTLRVRGAVYPALPRPAMAGAHQFGNAACAIAALWSLRERLPVALKALRIGLGRARQPGRFQVIGHEPLRVVDVGHNPHAARALARMLADLPPTGRVIGVLAMLADKDVDGVIAALKGRIHHWHLAGLDAPRGLACTDLARRVEAAGGVCRCHDNVVAAWRAACGEAKAADTILAFGSFLTAASVLSETPPHG
ncbi:MAG: bifunctional tetrahydrofolate synthase/dihydrofolate synthase [Betaproteobacteria bacterium]|nr:bifunctional tetrahydrofolate synthase/dihydrofolate synthase [Betaproteobacteria bacterium]